LFGGYFVLWMKRKIKKNILYTTYCGTMKIIIFIKRYTMMQMEKKMWNENGVSKGFFFVYGWRWGNEKWQLIISSVFISKTPEKFSFFVWFSQNMKVQWSFWCLFGKYINNSNVDKPQTRLRKKSNLFINYWFSL
jgi:hypothetical protein